MDSETVSLNQCSFSLELFEKWKWCIGIVALTRLTVGHDYFSTWHQKLCLEFNCLPG